MPSESKRTAHFPLYRRSGDFYITMVDGDEYDTEEEVQHASNDDGDNRDSNQAHITIDRRIYSSTGLHKQYGYHPINQTTPSEYVRSKRKQFKCGLDTVKKFLYFVFPVLYWLPKYDIRNDAICDFIAGITVGIVNIPQSMAFALLAVLPPVYGLYTAFFPALIFFLMGSSRHNSVGAFAVISIMCGDAVEKVIFRKYPSTTLDPTTVGPLTSTDFSSSQLVTTVENVTVNWNTTASVPCDAMCMERLKIHTSLCLLVGLIQILMAACRLGFVTVYLAQPLVRAFTTGAACHVITSQVPPILGISITRYAGPFSLIYTWRDIFMNIAKSNVATLLIGILALAILVPGKYLSERYKKKIKIPIPMELIVVIITILISHFGKIDMKFGVDVIGAIPVGFPTPAVPSSAYFSDLLSDAFSIAIVGFAISVSLAKIFAAKNDYEVDSNQEMMAYGTSNAVSSFFSCFVSASALARVSLLDNNGGKTQLAMVVSSVLVMFVLLVIGPLFEPLPKSVLAVIIIFALRGIMLQFTDLKPLFRTSKVDCSIWIVTWIAVFLLGVDIGLGVGVVYALLTVIVRTQLPRFSTEGRLPDSELYRDSNVYDSAKEHPLVKIFKMQSSLYYANSEQFRSTLYRMTGVNPVKALNKLRKTIATQRVLEQSPEELGGDAEKSPGDGANNNSVQSHAIDILPDIQLEAIVIDCSHFDFVDVVGAKTLATVSKEYERIGISVVFGACTDSVIKSVQAIAQFDESSGDVFYPTVHDAITSTMNCEQTIGSSGISNNALITTIVSNDVDTADVIV